MAMEVYFPGGKRVGARFDGQDVLTDQPPSNGGEGAAPGPFDLFLVSLATCAGYYVQEFFRARDLPMEGLAVRMETERDEAKRRLSRIEITVDLPPGFPEKYRKAVVRAAHACTVARHLEHPPPVEVTAR